VLRSEQVRNFLDFIGSAVNIPVAVGAERDGVFYVPQFGAVERALYRVTDLSTDI